MAILTKQFTFNMISMKHVESTYILLTYISDFHYGY